MILSLLVKNIRITLFSAVLLFSSSFLAAQSYNLNAALNGTTVDIPTATTVNFYDSGGSSGNYSTGENYTVTFKSENGQPLLITFTAFRTQNANNYLQIFNGPDITAPIIQTLSGNLGTPNTTIIPTSEFVTFRFVSNNNTVRNGWEATITSMDMSAADITACSGTFTDKQGGSNYTRNQYYKQTYRSGTPGDKLLFNFTSFNLGTNDRLIVLDGDSLTAPRVAYIGNGSPGTVISTNEALTFIFMANDDTNIGSGWSANISCFAVKTFYSYNDAYNWNNYRSWTLDPSGNTFNNPDNDYPTQFDKAVILNGKSITVSNSNNTVTQLDIREGGVLKVIILER